MNRELMMSILSLLLPSRGMRFENVSILIAHLKEIMTEMKYCWTDHQGLIRSQYGVFRVNCVDCLDRTNIVQTAIARTVMDIQVNLFMRLQNSPVTCLYLCTLFSCYSFQSLEFWSRKVSCRLIVGEYFS